METEEIKKLLKNEKVERVIELLLLKEPEGVPFSVLLTFVSNRLQKKIDKGNFHKLLEKLKSEEVVYQECNRKPYHLANKYFNLVFHNDIMNKINLFSKNMMFIPCKAGAFYGVSPDAMREKDVAKLEDLWFGLHETLRGIKERQIKLVIKQFYKSEFKKVMMDNNIEKKFYWYFLDETIHLSANLYDNKSQIRTSVENFLSSHNSTYNCDDCIYRDVCTHKILECPIQSYPKKEISEILTNLVKKFVENYSNILQTDFGFCFYFSPAVLFVTPEIKEFKDSGLFLTLPNYPDSKSMPNFLEQQRHTNIAISRSLGVSRDSILEIKMEKESKAMAINQIPKEDREKDYELYSILKEQFDFFRRKEEEIDETLGKEERRQYEKKVQEGLEGEIILILLYGIEYSHITGIDILSMKSAGLNYLVKRYKELGGDIEDIMNKLESVRDGKRKLTDRELKSIKETIQEYI